MSAECVSVFMSCVGAQLCPQPSVSSIPDQNESSHCLCDAFELASRKKNWERKMCYAFVDYVEQINVGKRHISVCLVLCEAAECFGFSNSFNVEWVYELK